MSLSTGLPSGFLSQPRVVLPDVPSPADLVGKRAYRVVGRLTGSMSNLPAANFPRYPLVEIGTAVVFALVTWGWKGTIVSASYCAMAAAMIAVSLIEYGGQRAPLSVAANGAAVALAVILVGSGWQHDWRIVGGALLGAAAGMVGFALLRARDPDCLDPRGFGRSALLIAGCWLGGLGLSAAAVGGATWIVAYFLSMLGAWSETRQASGANASVIASVRNAGPLLRVPLVSALGIAMAASLIARG